MRENLENRRQEDGSMVWQFEVGFDDAAESERWFDQLRSAFPVAAREMSRQWLSNESNQEEMAQVFATVWGLIQVARYSQEEDFNNFLQSNLDVVKRLGLCAQEIARLMVVLVDVAGRTRVRRVADAKTIRRRLSSILTILRQRSGADFDWTPLSRFPQIQEKKRASPPRADEFPFDVEQARSALGG